MIVHTVIKINNIKITFRQINKYLNISPAIMFGKLHCFLCSTFTNKSTKAQTLGGANIVRFNEAWNNATDSIDGAHQQQKYFYKIKLKINRSKIKK